ncbi:N/A [soil metagenome]
MISFLNVSKNFRKLKALDNFSLALNAPGSYAIIGPNGSGKTTLIKCLLGLVVPSSGQILFDNADISNDWRYRSKIGYMPQIGKYPDNISVGQLFDMMKNIRQGPQKIDEDLIDAFKLYKIHDKAMHALSGGTRQKVSAALTFLFSPPVLILDEPTAGLDPISVEILKEKILSERSKGKLFLVTSHILNDLEELTSHVAYVFEGKLQYSNSIEALKEETNEKKLSKAIATMIRQKDLITSITD